MSISVNGSTVMDSVILLPCRVFRQVLDSLIRCRTVQLFARFISFDNCSLNDVAVCLQYFFVLILSILFVVPVF